MKKIIFLLLFAVATISCHHSQYAGTSNKKADAQKGGSVGGNGLSIEEAIVISETSETDGVAAEYDWLKVNFPGYKLIKQSLIEDAGKHYDKMDIKTADGDKKTIYFDISNFFGKFWR